MMIYPSFSGVDLKMKVFARGEKKLKLKIWDVGEEAILINKEQFVSWFRCLTVGGSSGNQNHQNREYQPNKNKEYTF